MKPIENLLKDHIPKHSEFQIDNFIIGNQGNDWAQYKQALREINSRYDQVISLKEQLEFAEVEGNGKPNLLPKFLFSKRARVKAKIKARGKARARSALDDSLKHTQRELDRFVKLAEALKANLGEITPERRQALEVKAWFEKARKMAAVDLLLGGLSKPTMELIIALPPDDRVKIMREISSRPDPLKMLEL